MERTDDTPVGSAAPRAPAVGTTKADELTRVLEEMIVAGRLEAGRVLRQDELSRQFGVSRTPVREAFRQLAAVGLVSFVPNRGVRVRELDQDEWGQTFLARAALEATATRRAAERLTDADLRAIDLANEEFRRQTDLLRSTDLTTDERRRASIGWVAANDRFHDAILCAGDAPVIRRLISGLRRVFSGESLWTPGSAVDRLYDANLREHDAIRYALAARNPEASHALAHDHVLNSWDLLRAVLADAPRAADGLAPPTA